MTAAKGTILVTGANGGLGSAIVEQIVSKPEFSTYQGLYTVRDPSKAYSLEAVLKSGASHPHDVVALDLTKLDHVRLVAERINVCLLQLFGRTMLIMYIQDSYFFWRNSTTPRHYLKRRFS